MDERTLGERAGFSCDAKNDRGAVIGCHWPACSCPKIGEEGHWFHWSETQRRNNFWLWVVAATFVGLIIAAVLSY